MRTATIKVKLNSNSIASAIKKLDKEKQLINKRMLQLIDLMCKDGEKYACEYLTHIDTGATMNSIMGYREGNVGIIEVGGAAIWIEFGTGVIHNSGSDPFHPNRKELGISDWGTYGHGNGANPDGWYYYKNGKRYHTEGMPLEPFMANTAERLADEFKKTAEKIFK